MTEHEVPAAPPPPQRASDDEREATVERLRLAMSDGRLSLEELADRTEVAYAARTRDQLAELTVDLPANERAAGHPTAGAGRKWLVGTFGDLKRTGSWEAQGELGSVAVFGDVVLDLCGARLPTRPTGPHHPAAPAAACPARAGRLA